MLITNRATLHLLDGELHPSGFWAEEFAVPYNRFKQEQYEVDIATIDGIAPTVDQTSIDPGFMRYVRSSDSQEDDSAESAQYIRTIESTPALKAPMNVDTFTKDQVASYDGVYLSGGHGAIGDMAHSEELTQLFHWVLAIDKPIAAVCHGHCGLLNLRDSESNWPFAGYHLTCFSHSEELVTNMAGRLPFVLKIKVRRLGAIYEKGDVIWGSHVVVDRNLVTGQNPHSSKNLAEVFVKKLNALNA